MLFDRRIRRHRVGVKLPRTKGWWLLATLILAFVAYLAWQQRVPSDIAQHLTKLRAEGIPTTLIELDRWYLAVPDQENAALLVLDAVATFQAAQATNLPMVGSAPEPPRGQPWPTNLLAAARKHLADNAEGLKKLEAALLRPQARYPMDLRQGFNVVSVGQEAKIAAKELDLWARIAAESGRAAEAARCLRDQIALARTLEGSPVLLSHRVQETTGRMAVKSAERVLNRTAFSDDDLESLQRTFADAAASLSYERAMAGEMCMVVQQLRLPTKETRQQMGEITLPPFLMRRFIDVWADYPEALFKAYTWLYCTMGMRVRDTRFCLSYLDDLRVSARLPILQRQLAIRRLNEGLDQRLTDQYLPYARLLLPDSGIVAERSIREYALLRCAEVAFAVERWRLAHDGTPPASLEALVPQCLGKIPEDPLDGKPLKYRTLTSGYVIYSVGDDGTDDGGKEHMSGTTKTNGWDNTFTVTR